MVLSKDIRVACVQTGTKYDDVYVHALKAAVERYLPCEHDFVCFSDRIIDGIKCKKATLPGWWAKLHCFELEGTTLFFDLDLIITASLQPLLDWDGFGIIDDWNCVGVTLSEPKVDAIADGQLAGTKTEDEHKYITPMFNSSVMKLTGNERHVWDLFKPAIMDRFPRGGDQRWITRCMPNAKTFPAEWFSSYKLCYCQDGPPPGTLAVVFHGYPKMHEFTTGWVPKMWPNLEGEKRSDT